MTGDEHYAEAERLVRGNAYEVAKVHALLALAAFAREDHPAGPGPYTGVGL